MNVNKLYNRFKNRVQNNKGVTTIEIGLSAILIIIALSGFIDMVNMSQKMDTASSVTGYVGRVVGNQGGLMQQPSVHHLDSYVTTPQLYREVQTTLAKGGFTEKDFTLEINGQVVKPDTNVETVSFGERIPIKLTVKYDWELMSMTVPGTIGGTKTSKREVVSSFKIREGDIQSDFKAGN